MKSAKWSGAVALLLLVTGCVGAKWYRPDREVRSTSAAAYELSVQKNGLLDINLMSHQPVFHDAFPMVWMEGEENPRALELEGYRSMRQPVQSRLGQGQGMLFQKDETELLVETFPTQPFFTVQAAYTNNGKEPVKVHMLMPWCASGLSLGTGTADAVILENGRVFEGEDFPKLTKGQALSDWNLAVLNPGTGRSLIAGFLTNERARTRIRIERSPQAPADVFDVFRAECVYEPAVVVPPGGVLKSERLYVAVAEPNAFEGLERYGHAMAIANGIARKKPFLPHGWDSWNTKNHTNIDEQTMLVALDFIDKNLKRYGWTHFAIDDGWQLARGDWEADPEKFPRGMKWFADNVHARGMTFGLWVDAFRVDVDSAVARAHPEWLRKGSAQAGDLVAENQRIIDITAPGAYEHVRDVFARLGKEWGVDALMEADFVYLLLMADSYYDTSLTRVEILRKGMQAIREGFGDDRVLVTMPPLGINGVFADSMRIGNDCAPIWRKHPDRWPWGCVEAMTNAARRYYFEPYVWATDPDCAYFGHVGTRARWRVLDVPPLTRNQSLAWFTGSAMVGGVVLNGDNFTDLTPEETDVLQRVLPTAGRPARPIDLFEAENPRVWSLPLKNDAGDWHILALFNWNEKADETVSVELGRLGLQAGRYYTVYNFWGDTYHGTVTGRIEMRVPAGSVQLLGLRPFENRPMFLAHDRHFAQGGLDVTALNWDATARKLSGTLQAVGDTDYGLRVLVPPPYAARGAASSAGTPAMETRDQVVRLRVHAAQTGPLTWEVQF